MEIDDSETQSRKAETSIHESLEPDSKMTVEREEQPMKHPSQSRSTERGMEIDESTIHALKALASMHESLELDSNMTVKREEQAMKHSS
jgi:hypothetical protein